MNTLFCLRHHHAAPCRECIAAATVATRPAVNEPLNVEAALRAEIVSTYAYIGMARQAEEAKTGDIVETVRALLGEVRELHDALSGLEAIGGGDAAA